MPKSTNQPKPQPPVFVTSQAVPHYTVDAACLICKAPIHGEWLGEPKRQTLECSACGQIHIVDIGEKHEAKPSTESKLKPPFSEDVMRLALSRLASVAQHLQGNADDDDPVAILSGAIDELLHKRNAMAGVQQWMQQWLAENVRR